jgi:CRP-like cAMP-binding protein
MGVYLICEGSVEISISSQNNNMVLATLGENAIFGEMALIDHSVRSAKAVALTSTWCYILNKYSFEQRLNDLDPFMRGLFRVLTEGIRGMNERVKANGEATKRLPVAPHPY